MTIFYEAPSINVYLLLSVIGKKFDIFKWDDFCHLDNLAGLFLTYDICKWIFSAIYSLAKTE